MNSLIASSISASLSDSLPKMLEPKIKQLVNASIDKVPNEEGMSILGKQVSGLIIKFVNENILPGLYNRSIEYSTEMALKGVTFDEEAIDKLYNKLVDVFPETISFNLNNVGGYKKLDLKIKDVRFRKMVKSALTKKKLKMLLNDRFAPFLDEINKTAVPVVKKRVINIAIMSTLVTASVSSLITYYIMKNRNC